MDQCLLEVTVKRLCITYLIRKKATATTNSFDLIMATIKALDRLPISFSHRHVPAHQDISRDEMDIWGRENGDCNTDAKAFWKKKKQQVH
jgi:hypothetical protein